MSKSIILRIRETIKTLFTASQRKKDRQKMMTAYLKIKAGKLCATYNKEVTA